MNRAITRALLWGIITCTPAFGGSFDCQFAYTPVEQAICSNPELKSLDQDLGRISVRAVDRGLASSVEIRSMRDNLVRQCRNAARLSECLISAEQEEIAKFALQLGDTTEVPPSIAGAHSGSPGWWSSVRSAADRLASAEVLLQRYGDPEPMIVAAVDLLELYRLGLARTPADTELASKIRRLEEKLTRGCDSDFSGRQWQQLLSENGQVCRS